MKQKFVIFNFSKGYFWDTKLQTWVGDQMIVEGFSARIHAEDFFDTYPEKFDKGDNFTILTFYYR